MKHPKMKGKDGIINVNEGMKNKDSAKIKVLDKMVDDLRLQINSKEK
jgi:hypothetical protein